MYTILGHILSYIHVGTSIFYIGGVIYRGQEELQSPSATSVNTKHSMYSLIQNAIKVYNTLILALSIIIAGYKQYIFNRVGVYLSNTANCFSTVVSVNNFNSTTKFFQFKLLLLMLYSKRSLEVKSFDKLGKLQQNLQSFVSPIFTISIHFL